MSTETNGNVTRKELTDAVQERLGGGHRQAAELVDTFFSTMHELLVKNRSIKIVQFGTLQVRNKSPRRGRNPKTGESMTITRRRMVSFRVSKELRERINGKS